MADELDERTRRALTECMTVFSSGPLYTVVGENGGGEYTVDTHRERCTCADYEYRGVECKHIRRAQFATGERAIDAAALAQVDVDDLLGAHIDETPAVTIETDADALAFERAESTLYVLLDADADELTAYDQTHGTFETDQTTVSRGDLAELCVEHSGRPIDERHTPAWADADRGDQYDGDRPALADGGRVDGRGGSVHGVRRDPPHEFWSDDNYDGNFGPGPGCRR